MVITASRRAAAWYMITYHTFITYDKVGLMGIRFGLDGGVVRCSEFLG